MFFADRQLQELPSFGEIALCVKQPVEVARVFAGTEMMVPRFS
jgi:hypothetical protein